MSERRQACFLIEAPKGEVNATRKELGQVFREVLGCRKWNVSPHYVSYISKEEIHSFGEETLAMSTARYTVYLTDAEMSEIQQELNSDFVDIYHD